MIQFNKYLLTLLISIPFFVGCADDDGYTPDKFWVEVVSVIPLEEGGYYIQLDNGKKLLPVASTAGIPESRTRAQVNYTILADQTGDYNHSVKINYMSSILTKNIVRLTEENNESLGDDKIKILELWEGDDFLNIHFGVNVGGGGVLHSVNLVDMGEVEEGFKVLEFRHNANGDVENYGAKGLIAFDLRPYQEEESPIEFKIKLNAFSGSDSEYIFTYDYTGTKGRSYHSEVEVSTDDLVIE